MDTAFLNQILKVNNMDQINISGIEFSFCSKANKESVFNV